MLFLSPWCIFLFVSLFVLHPTVCFFDSLTTCISIRGKQLGAVFLFCLLVLLDFCIEPVNPGDKHHTSTKLQTDRVDHWLINKIARYFPHGFAWES